MRWCRPPSTGSTCRFLKGNRRGRTVSVSSAADLAGEHVFARGQEPPASSLFPLAERQKIPCSAEKIPCSPAQGILPQAPEIQSFFVTDFPDSGRKRTNSLLFSLLAGNSPLLPARSAAARKRPGTLPLDPFRTSPILEQRAARLGRALVDDGDARHPVEAEMAEALPHLAPGGEHQNLVEKPDRDRPDHPVRAAPLLVGIGEGELALAAK